MHPSDSIVSAQYPKGHLSRSMADQKNFFFGAVSSICDRFLPKNIFTGEREFQFLPTCLEINYAEYVKRETIESLSKQEQNEQFQNTKAKIDRIIRDLSPYAQRPDPNFHLEYQSFLIPKIPFDSKPVIQVISYPGGVIKADEEFIDKCKRVIKELSFSSPWYSASLKEFAEECEQIIDLKEVLNSKVTDDDVIAFVIAHEMAHIASGHTMHRLCGKSILICAIETLFWAVLTYLYSSQTALFFSCAALIPFCASVLSAIYPRFGLRDSTLFKVIEGVGNFLNPLSRIRLFYLIRVRQHFEYEADKSGIKLLHRANYPLQGALLVPFVCYQAENYNIMKESKGVFSKRKMLPWFDRTFMMTHPENEKRLKANKKTIEEIENDSVEKVGSPFKTNLKFPSSCSAPHLARYF